MALTEAQVNDLVEELQLLRLGKAFHVHTDLVSGERKRCSSPYCVDLTLQGVRDHA